MPNRLEIKSSVARSCILAVGISLLGGVPASAVTLEWTRQLGTTQSDTAFGVTADGLGNVYISGSTQGNLGGPNAGGSDGFVAKYDAAGSLVWTRQFGTPNSESADVIADGLGNVYISGNLGPLDGNPSLAKYDAAGELLWARPGDLGAMSADGLGNVYISGNTMAKYDDDGNLLWTRTRQLSITALGGSSGVSADGLGNVYISGTTTSYDPFVAKYNAEGTLQWSRELGTLEQSYGFDVSADGLGNVYLTGIIFGTPADIRDAFVAKYDETGSLLWTRQFGDYAASVIADGLGNVYISGSLGQIGADRDASLTKFDAQGNQIWTHRLGTSALDGSYAVSTDGLRNVYIAGETHGNLGGPSAGGADVFVSKFIDSSDGDFNNDGTVDAADYIVWRNGLGAGYAQAHYDDWRANFGKTAAGAAAVAEAAPNTAVPEPSTILLSALGLAHLARYRRGIWPSTRSRK